MASPPHASPDDQRERLIPFPSRTSSEADLAAYGANARRRERRERERAARRRPARRRHRTPWLQRNALSVAAVSVLVALLGLGFGMLQLLNRPETPALLAVEPSEQTQMTASSALSPPGAQQPAPAAEAPPAQREVQAAVRVIEPTYTVEAGDTLARIALRYNTTVERIQALNNLSDPRTLRIGTRLIIPPPL
jgi:nucleoid-associated protein YgaU